MLIKKILLSSLVLGCAGFFSCTDLSGSSSLGQDIVDETDPSISDFNRNFSTFSDSAIAVQSYSIGIPVDTSLGYQKTFICAGQKLSREARGSVLFTFDSTFKKKHVNYSLESITLQLDTITTGSIPDTFPKSLVLFNFNDYDFSNTHLLDNAKKLAVLTGSKDPSGKIYYKDSADTSSKIIGLVSNIFKINDTSVSKLRFLITSRDSLVPLKSAATMILKFKRDTMITKDTIFTKDSVITKDSVFTKDTVITKSNIFTKVTITPTDTVTTADTVTTMDTISIKNTVSTTNTISVIDTISIKVTITTKDTLDTLRSVSSNYIVFEGDTLKTHHDQEPVTSSETGRKAVFALSMTNFWKSLNKNVNGTNYKMILSAANISLKASVRPSENNAKYIPFKYYISNARYNDQVALKDSISKLGISGVIDSTNGDSASIRTEYFFRKYAISKPDTLYFYINNTNTNPLWQETLWQKIWVTAVFTNTL